MAYNVLIVDDSSTMRTVIKKTISACGFNTGQFYEAANGREALDILRAEWLDVVVTDYNMPDMDGMELIAKMKTDEVLKSIPVVVVTTEGSQQRVKEFIEKGAADYIRKPFSPEEIRDKLKTIMGEPVDGSKSLENGDDGLDF